MWMKWMEKKPFGQLFQTECLGENKNDSPNHVPREKKEQCPRDKRIKFPLRTTSIKEQVSKCLRKIYKE
jgi:hypothetical protein